MERWYLQRWTASWHNGYVGDDFDGTTKVRSVSFCLCVCDCTNRWELTRYYQQETHSVCFLQGYDISRQQEKHSFIPAGTLAVKSHRNVNDACRLPAQIWKHNRLNPWIIPAHKLDLSVLHANVLFRFCSALRVLCYDYSTFSSKHSSMTGCTDLSCMYTFIFFFSLFIRSVLQNIQRQKSDNMFLTIIHLYVPQLVTAALLCSACWFVFKKKAVVMYVDAEHVKASTWKRVKCKVKMNNICWKWSNLYFISKYSQRYHQINALNSW